MSIVNIWIEPTRALVATDTRAKGQVPGQPEQWLDVDKMAAFDSQRVVLANRGNLGIFLAFTDRMRSEGAPWDIHWLATNGARVAREVRCEVLSRAGVTGLQQLPAVLDGSEIFAVGWSAPLGQMVGFCLELTTAGGYAMEQVHAWCAAPQAHDVWPTVGDVPPLSNVEEMIAAAREQVRYFRSRFPQEAIGGCLGVAELMPTGIRVSQGHRL